MPAKFTDFVQFLEKRIESNLVIKEPYEEILHAFRNEFKAELLDEAGSMEENDSKAFNLHNKAVREKRMDKLEDWFDRIILSPEIKDYSTDEGMGKYTFTTVHHGVVDFFPKANKILIRKDNHWEKPGLKWLIQITKAFKTLKTDDSEPKEL